MKIFIYLKNEIEAFDMTSYINQKISKNFPQIEIESFEDFSELAARITEPDILLTWSFKEELYSQATNLKYIFTPAAGWDWVPPDPQGKVEVVYGKFHGPIMAESLLGNVLHFSQKKHLLNQRQMQHKWDKNLQSETRLLKDQTILIIGYGSIGRACAKLFKLFGCRVIGLKRSVSKPIDKEGVELITQDCIEEALGVSDHVILILPSDKSTDGYFVTEYFRLMKKTAYLYNLGRGNTIATEELIKALENEEISGAALDVFEEEPLPKSSPLWDTRNLIVSPHSVCICQNYRSSYFMELESTLREVIENH
ncbi:MAG: D-2-hydroxyacid dehydrogenase [Spirochaetaceae bacterium]|jgi:D-2-hydroxyacid dehydrogenase (NADP+)|nr:D-2-hydroxyacid dehydrogenase [Spirochaetaceae bacterium]